MYFGALMNYFLRSLSKLCVGLIADFLLTICSVWPVVWKYNYGKSVQVS
jgi:hypothetical protein